MTDNTALWQAVEKTPPAHTKAITGKAYSGTSPKPHYLVWKATETFGPCGIGWGFEILDEKLMQGALIEPGFYEQIHMARVRVWYEWSGKRGQVEHVGQTLFSGKRANGKPFTDEDAPKKSVTDALIKALSMIGFAGDIFMGRYDDSKYVADLKREETPPAISPQESRNSKTGISEQTPREQQRALHEPIEMTEAQRAIFETAKLAITEADDAERLRKWGESDGPKIKANLPPNSAQQIRTFYEARMNDLKRKEAA